MQRRARPWGHRCMARWTGAILGSSLGSSWGVQGPYHTNPSLVPFRQWDRHRICHRIAMDHSFPRTVPPSDRNRNRRPPRTTTPHSASRIAPPPDHRRSPPANHRHSATSPALPTFFLPPAHLEREWVSTIFVRPDGDWGREREALFSLLLWGVSQLDQLSLPLVGRRAFLKFATRHRRIARRRAATWKKAYLHAPK